MGLAELTEDVEENYGRIEAKQTIELDRETRTELAMLMAALDPEDTSELIRRGIRTLFQATVDTAQLDFHLRTNYDVTYDEYLSGMTYEDMTGGSISYPQQTDDDRRYQF